MSFTLPKTPVLRLMVVGSQCCGPEWKLALAKALGTTPRVVRYWAADHCPKDLDERLLAAIDNMIAENHSKAATLADFRRQLVGRMQ